MTEKVEADFAIDSVLFSSVTIYIWENEGKTCHLNSKTAIIADPFFLLFNNFINHNFLALVDIFWRHSIGSIQSKIFVHNRVPFIIVYWKFCQIPKMKTFEAVNYFHSKVHLKSLIKHWIRLWNVYSDFRFRKIIYLYLHLIADSLAKSENKKNRFFTFICYVLILEKLVIFAAKDWHQQICGRVGTSNNNFKTAYFRMKPEVTRIIQLETIFGTFGYIITP